MADFELIKPTGNLPTTLENGLFPPFISTPQPDFVIKSSDGIRFQVHCLFLHASSSFFATMLSIPQPKAAPLSPPDAAIPLVDVTESSAVMAQLLRLIYPIPLPVFKNMNSLSKTVLAAEKYDMQGAMSTLRKYFLQTEFLNRNPIHVYGLASRFGWKEEKKAAFHVTLTLSNIYNSRYADILSELGTPVKDTFSLLALRQQRITGLTTFLQEDSFRINVLAPALNCPRQGCTLPFSNMVKAWTSFKLAIIEEFSKRPLGDDSFWCHFLGGNGALINLFHVSCNCPAPRPMDVGHVLSKIRTFMNQLPDCE
ncbi:hypothetical protein BU17DRAFT_94050 [Hysterangium stoloniferum]|nr:hypothetical protein BU17DRAFT_94050 [Hysterangium stoloniferum]